MKIKKSCDIEKILVNLSEFDVKKISFEDEILKISIRINPSSDINMYEKIIKNRFLEYKVQIIFFTKDEKKRNFKKILGISSGKGGVGKSIIALNFAYCLRDLGYSVGILDADIYSPSIPGMLDVFKNPISLDGSSIEPIKTRDIQILSMGLFLQENQSPIWQESILEGAFKQFLLQGNWDCEYLIIDFAGGMSCLYSSCLQIIPNIEIILISLPNRMVYRDVLRMYALLKGIGMNVLGVIDNMSESLYDTSIFSNEEFNFHGLNKIGNIPYFKEYLNFIENGYPNDYKLTFDFDFYNRILSSLI